MTKNLTQILDDVRNAAQAELTIRETLAEMEVRGIATNFDRQSALERGEICGLMQRGAMRLLELNDPAR